MRLACDTGGTFTDLIVEDDLGMWRMYKASTDARDPVAGVLATIGLAAADRSMNVGNFLASCSVFVHGTTHALNAVLTGRAARTALLVTQGHPDVLTLREGGRPDPFDFKVSFPTPYVPRALTFEVPERLGASGEVVTPLDETAAVKICKRLVSQGVEAVAVCLLWSPANGAHERRLGELLEEHLPGVPYTLSHRLNPVPREYRRASATCIDASLKPLIKEYMGSLTGRLQHAGFDGRVLVVTSKGGVVDAQHVAEAPIHILNSGPSMAPVAGRSYGEVCAGSGDIIVADMGGTTFDVSIVRGGTIGLTRELWVGPPLLGHLTGLPSVDVRSVGAGGGSIAVVDGGQVLHVGPHSAGARPGPACYGRGGQEPTVTDAAVVLGYIDPKLFLNGTMPLDGEAARRVIAPIAEALQMPVEGAAQAVLALATETMAQAIMDISTHRGLDPSAAMLVAAGGAAGLNIVDIARRLGCSRVLVPETAAAFSAAGALLSDLITEERAMLFTSTRNFDWQGVKRMLTEMRERCADFMRRSADPGCPIEYAYFAEGRYADQAWEIEIALPLAMPASVEDATMLREAFDREHERLYSYCDPRSAVEFVGWRVSAVCKLQGGPPGRMQSRELAGDTMIRRRGVYLDGRESMVPVHRFESLCADESMEGPAIVESCLTTVVVNQGRFYRSEKAGLIIELK